MNQLTLRIPRVLVVGAFVLLMAPLVHAADNGIAVSGFTIPIADANFEGRSAGPNFIAERTLYQVIFPCSTAFPFCAFDSNGFQGSVVTAPERVVSINQQGNRFFRMLARKTITGFA